MDSVSEILIRSGFVAIDCRLEASLLRPEVVAKLAASLNENASKKIALIAPKNAQDATPMDIEHLLHEVPRARFVEAQLNLRMLLKQAHEQGRLGVFVGEGSCIGSWWDVGLWFHRRFWLGGMGRVGGEEFTHGLFAGSGGLLNRLLREYDKWKSLAEHSAIEVIQAVRESSIDAAGDSSTLPMFLSLATRQEQLAHTRAAMDQKPTSVRKSIFSRFRSSANVSIDFSQCSTARQMFELVRKTVKLNIDDSIFESIMQQANTQMLMRKNLSKFLSSTSKHLVSGTVQKSPIRSVQLKATSLAPPVAFLLAAQRRDLSILLYGESPAELSRMSETVQTRLSRVLSTDIVSGFCEKNLICFTAHEAAPCSAQTVQVTWTVDDRLLLRTDDHVAEVYCVSGSDHRGDVQFVEASSSLSEDDETILSAMGMRIFKSPQEGSLLSVKLRSRLVDALLQMAVNEGISVDVIVDALNASGWRFMGERKLLDRFVRYHYSGVHATRTRTALVNDFEQLFAVAQSKLRVPKSETQARLNIHQTCLHTFSGIVHEMVSESIDGQADQLRRAVLLEAAGVPTSSGSLDFIFEQVGQRRLAAIKEQQASITRPNS
jgi:hypothetical protein